MAKLIIDEMRNGIAISGKKTIRVSGFRTGELNELKSMSHEDAIEKLIEMLDSRNNGTGTCYQCGNGLYGVWFDNEYAYMNIGDSCD